MSNIEALVANINDLQNGETKQVLVGETEVLLAKINNKFYAVGAHCTHYKAPLAEGVINGESVICPWHNACFSLVTGDRQAPPGLDALPRYQVRVDGDRIIVSVPASAAPKRTPAMAQFNLDADSRTFVVLGAGAAGSAAVEKLRQVGFQGRIIMVTQEDKLPYDRTWLSKDYLTGKVSPEEMPLRTEEFYQDKGIEVLLNKQVVSVDAVNRVITFADDSTLGYDSLLLATGGKPRQLDVEGANLENVFTLRSFQDIEQILAAAKQATRVVVIGSSFIGMETAAGLTQHGLQVTVVSPSGLPFEKILGKEIGQLFQTIHEEQGVTFRLKTKVTKLEGNGKVEAVILDDGDRLSADFVVVGIGVQPATEYIQGIELNEKDKSVIVDKHLCAADGLYAAGDIARFPDWRTDSAIRVEHWRIAAQHGEIAAANMAGQKVEFTGVPVFWTAQFEFPLRYVGHTEEWDEIIFDGELEKREFIAFYIKGDRVLAAAASQRDTEMAAISELMRLDKMPTAEQLRAGSVDTIEQLKQVQT
ncbi:FAD-dependent oxidoreductase [Aliterella atlantica]|uniref:NAD(FAD)-dependent dehydrogenase n=1 Tax=Aliterella atlantica CENA595 TaxID=1618023 RepID=A0A0D8ZYW5_9CYAN|nr:FAD-dependent oxidoreductase [Aliterella atlantica]KJH72396.1 NAD(FAD)-dependent dehydrogenase [Aliterella atlantica CENA595]